MAAAIVAASLALSGGVAYAQSFTVSPSTIAPGGTVNIAGDSCFVSIPPPPIPVSISVSPSINGLQSSINLNGTTGAWTGTMTIPASASPGVYTVTARCTGRFTYPTQTLTVTGTTGSSTTTSSTTTPRPSTTTTTLPRTGTCGGIDDIESQLADLRRLLGSSYGERLDALIARLEALLARVCG